MATDYKQISELPQASSITNSDLFVVQQNGTAKKVTGTTFLAMVEAHGGISTVTLNANYTLSFTFADGTTWTSSVPIRGETGATGATGQTGATGATGNGIASAVLNQDYTLTLNFTDGTSYTTTSIRGQQGATGDTGASASISTTEYGTSASSSTQPSSWQVSIPTVSSGSFLWTRYTWNNGGYSYMCTRYGSDGQGSGDMLASVYDANSAVSTAGGIQAFVNGYKPTSFAITLSSSGWSNNSQTVSDARFIASGFDYIVKPADTSYMEYASSSIYAEDVDTNGQITFNCSATPTNNLTVNVLKIGVA